MELTAQTYSTLSWNGSRALRQLGAGRRQEGTDRPRPSLLSWVKSSSLPPFPIPTPSWWCRPTSDRASSVRTVDRRDSRDTASSH
jgi:hypothetical protein